jgi:hypothetical protein
MPALEDFIEAKRILSKQLLKRGLEGEVTRHIWTMDVSAASEMAKTNVHAVGVGRKLVEGKASREFCIRLYVTQKLPVAWLTKRAHLPKEIDGLPTDVIESPPPFFAVKKKGENIRAAAASCSDARQARQRPIVAGISAAHNQVTAGTLACFCKSKLPHENRDIVYGLSNNHIFANLNRAQPGDLIRQPSPLDGGNPSDVFATFTRCVKLFLNGTTPNRVDAAIVAVSPDIGCRFEICGIGTITGTESPREGALVRKHGRTSGYTEGRISDVAYDGLIGMDSSAPGVAALFQNQIRIDRVNSFPNFALPGDSGSLVISKTHQTAVGLFFACPASGNYGIANPIAGVLDEMQIELIIT